MVSCLTVREGQLSPKDDHLEFERLLCLNADSNFDNKGYETEIGINGFISGFTHSKAMAVELIVDEEPSLYKRYKKAMIRKDCNQKELPLQKPKREKSNWQLGTYTQRT